MTALRDADGRVIGTGGCGKHLCVKSHYERRRFGCQTKAMDALPSDRIPVCPKVQAFRDRTCEITADGRTIGKNIGDQTMMTSRDRQAVNGSLRRHGLKLGADGVAVPLEGYKENVGGNDEKLRGLLKEMGILEEDIEAVVARLNEADGADAAPYNMGSGESELSSAVSTGAGMSDPNAGGGSTRTYAPVDNGNYGMDVRGRRMAGDASSHVAQVMARRHRQYAAGQISHADLHRPIAPPIIAADTKSFEARFPDAKRIGA